MSKLFGRKKLDEALYDAGIITYLRGGYRWLLFREKKGLITCPRDPSNGLRKFTEKQITEIVKAFSPGGKGEWKYNERRKE